MIIAVLHSSQIETFRPKYLIFLTTVEKFQNPEYRNFLLEYVYLHFCNIKECGPIFAKIRGGKYYLRTVFDTTKATFHET